MNAKREQWNYSDGTTVWLGRYRNSHNMPHWHYDCELLLVERGSLDIFCERSKHVVKAGDAFFVGSGQVHYMHAHTPDTVLTMLIFNYDIIKDFLEQYTLDSPLLSGDYNLPKFFDTLKNELKTRKVFYQNKSASEVAGLMIDIFRREKISVRKPGTRVPDIFKGLLEEIDEKYEFYDLENAAKYMNMNPTYFSRLFHQLAGMTFSQYLNYVKTEHAVDMLQSRNQYSMTEIANRCGFATIRNFNRIFKEYTGYTPRALPKDFVMKENFTESNPDSSDPTFEECVLLESTDDVA